MARLTHVPSMLRKIEALNFGTMQGEAVVRSSCKFLVEFRKYEQWLLSFAGCEDETAAMDMTIGLLECKEAAKAVQYIGITSRKGTLEAAGKA